MNVNDGIGLERIFGPLDGGNNDGAEGLSDLFRPGLFLDIEGLSETFDAWIDGWKNGGGDRFGDDGDVGGNAVGGDTAAEGDAIADALGDLVNELGPNEQGTAIKINELESELREALADGELTNEEIDEIADKIGALVKDLDGPLASKLQDIENDLRGLADNGPEGDGEVTGDSVADALGSLANELEPDNQDLAKKINDLETELRRALADGELTDEEIDEIADKIGALVNDIDDDADTAVKLNDIESDLRGLAEGADGNTANDTGIEGGLEVDGNNKIDTGRYEIVAKKDEVLIKDKETDTWVKAWGDPHFHTSDGDKAQFHTENLTLDLPDGTKVTITPTEKMNNGLSFVDKVVVTKGDEAVVMSGIHEGKISNTGVMDGEGVADGVDLSFEDGTVLEAGNEIDDLFFTDDMGNRTEELVGQDRSQRFNEHMLDGRGGASDLGAEN